MHLIESATHLTSIADAQKLTSPTERAFAMRCIVAGCIVWHQVSIGSSLIDFLIINPRVQETSNKVGTLVEVTQMRKADKDVKLVKAPGKKSKKKIPNRTGERKNRQIEAMRASGYRWTILYGENLPSINRFFLSQSEQV